MPTYTYTAIHDPSANSGTYPYGINDAGQIVGYYDVVTLEPHVPVDHWHGFLYAGGTYTTLDYPAAVYTYAYGINASGQILGTYTNGPYHGFVYSGGTYTRTFDDPSATSITFAQGINASGDIVGYYQNSSTGYHGFLYSGGSYTTLDDSSGAAGSTLAHGINASGQIVGEYVDSGGTSHGFLYSGGTYTTLTNPFAINGDPNHTNGTVALGINDAGQIVGYYYGSPAQPGASPPRHGFIYSGGIYTTIDDPSANFLGTSVTGINNLGQIVGYGQQGFLATLGPNPPAPAGTSADMILRHGSDGLYEIYDIGNNAILAAYSLGQVGTDWQFVGLGLLRQRHERHAAAQFQYRQF
jgi:probable HAF family extracellular repeat protein